MLIIVNVKLPDTVIGVLVTLSTALISANLYPVFAFWIVSYDKTYAFIVLNNISLEAVFVEKTETVEKNPFVTMGELTTSVVSGKYRLSYNGQFF